ncbi:aspartate dehydrogenase [Roseicyclus mahoneyensis]|uniref:L-aspartate dehydrogenase n=1 Tax=Roseicyclus mahoneyensis TaxID=164332 RepID=A0A316GAU6_9RHOB|nr:aspartate dehydrogenase [Roseicyclus mahoneyensis]PWK57335.1 aspartate dehydrogenase [Roseicyclus mahoneyensis]
MRVAVIGAGSIGGWVIAALEREGLGPEAVIVRGTAPEGVRAVRSVADLPAGVTHLVDCAGHAGLAAHGPGALAAGIDVITLSLGALADAGLARDLALAAEAGCTRLHLASGAIGALDALRAGAVGGLSRVRYTGRKPPAGWVGSPAEAVLDLSALTAPAAHFEGTAREAALRYPKNANVAAAVALAGLGFDATQARLVADPEAGGNIHEIEAEGVFGSFRFEITGAALPDTPRSSALAAMSVVAELRRLGARVTT